MTTPYSEGAIAPGGEVLPNINLEPSLEHESRLAELFAISAEVAEVQRPVLWEMVKTGLAGCVDPHDQRAMQLTGHVLDWQLFGRRGDDLPAGLIWNHGENGSHFIDYDPRLYFSGSCRSEAQRRLYGLGLETVISQAAQDIESRRGEIYEATSTLIKTLPEYRLVQSLNMQLPPESKPLPLSPFFRIVRERQVEESVRLQHGVQGEIDPRSTAATALRRNLQRLDDETMPRKGKADPNDDALARAREFFGSKVFDECGTSYTRESLDRFDIEDDEDGGELVIRFKEEYIDPDDDDYAEAVDHIYYTAQALAEGLSGTNTPTQEWLGTGFLDYFMRRVLDPRTNADYDLIVEEAIQKTSASLVHDYINDLHNSGAYHYDMPSYLRLPGGERMHSDRHRELSSPHNEWHYRHSKGLGFTTAAELDKLEQKTIGLVTKRPYGDNEMRLIQSYARDDQIPEFRSNDELRLRLMADAFRFGADPYIPGYRLNSRSGDDYGFVRDSVDPYARADIILSTEQRDTLAGQYVQLGLRSLADSIRREQALTVDGLVDLLRGASYYPTPVKVTYAYETDESGDELPSRFEVSQLSDFSALVKDDVLQAQCNGSAKFLQLSLEMIFGSGSSSVAVGNVMDAQREITAAGHAQTTFVHDDHVYLLDATPYSGSMRRRGQGMAQGGQLNPPHAATLDVPDIPDQPDADLPALDVTELRRLRLASLQYALEMQLGALLGVRDRQALYERVATLSTDDPVRRTLEVFIRAPKEETTQEELERLSAYLKQYKQAPNDLLAQMGVPAYEASTIDSLIGPLEQIARYYS